MGIAQSTLTDKELSKLFKAVDVDGGGTVDASEFLKWLFDKQNGAAKSPKGSKKKSKGSIAQVKRRFDTRLSSRALSPLRCCCCCCCCCCCNGAASFDGGRCTMLFVCGS